MSFAVFNLIDYSRESRVYGSKSDATDECRALNARHNARRAAVRLAPDTRYTVAECSAIGEGL